MIEALWSAVAVTPLSLGAERLWHVTPGGKRRIRLGCDAAPAQAKAASQPPDCKDQEG